jgi:hypothetical protein
MHFCRALKVMLVCTFNALHRWHFLDQTQQRCSLNGRNARCPEQKLNNVC